MKFLSKALLLVSALFSGLALAKSTGTGQEVSNGYNVAVTWDEISTIVTFKVVIPKNTWFGIVLGSVNHMNSDMLLFVANGANSKFFDTYSEGNFEPKNDPQQDLTGTFEQTDTEIKFTVMRKANTGDAKDFMIVPDKTTQCAWALNSITSDRRSKHTLTDRFTF